MNTSFTSEDVLIRVQPTPNPSAWKFIINHEVLIDGKITYADREKVGSNKLAEHIFAVPGVRQIHFFSNVITVTHDFDVDIDDIQESVVAVIRTRLPVHDPKIDVNEGVKKNRESLPKEIQLVESILDRTVRPHLQADGGDIEVIQIEEETKVYIHFEGACGGCPSSTTGTLMAIEGILQDEFNPNVEVIPV